MYDDVPFLVDDQQCFFAFYEVEISDKSINLVPLLVDGILYRSEKGPRFENRYSIRNGNWYIAIEGYNDFEKDCLVKESLSRQMVLKYLRDLKNQYLTTSNYNETVFKN
jgi:hypothetical protein